MADLASLLRDDDLVVLNETRVLPARVPVRRDTPEVRARCCCSSTLPPRSSRPLVATTPTPVVAGAVPAVAQAACRPRSCTRSAASWRSRSARSSETVRRLVRPLHDGELWPHSTGPARHRCRPTSTSGWRTRALPDGVLPAGCVGGGPHGGVAPDPPRCSTRCTTGCAGRDRRAGRGVGHVPSISTERVEDHVIHSEQYSCRPRRGRRVELAREQGRRIVAVGTTTVRALESVATLGRSPGARSCSSPPASASRPSTFDDDQLHLPRSSLLAMIEAFVGARWRGLYAVAVDERYGSCPSAMRMLLQGTTTAPPDLPPEHGGAP